MAKLKTVDPSPYVVAFVNDLKAVLGRHKRLSAMEMLAGTAQLVGMLIALQDSTTLEEAEVMEIVAQNISAGNRAAIDIALPVHKRD